MTARQRRESRGNTVARGYGAAHQALRKRVAADVEAGIAFCTAPECVVRAGRWIPPGSPFDLGHLPDRSGYAGPQHPVCNRRDGGKRGNPPGIDPKTRRKSRPVKVWRRQRWQPTQPW
jgi:hypothetical protein